MTNIEKKIIRPLDAEELTLEQAVQVTGGTGESIMYSSDDIEKDDISMKKIINYTMSLSDEIYKETDTCHKKYDIHCCNLSHLE